MKNFVAIDFETAMAHHICAVGIVAVEDGQVVDEYYSLVQPPDNAYSWFTVKVHGIRPEDTINAPTFYQVYPEIKKRLYGKLVVAHNESFDRRVLQQSMRDNMMDYSDLNIADKWECTMRACRASKRYPSGKLNECCALEGIALKHHEALSDARGCAELFLRLNEPRF